MFKTAYSEPRDRSLIERAYKYAEWCELQSRAETADDDLLTCAFVCFYEEIPRCESAWEDMTYWFTKEEFQKVEAGFAERTFRSPGMHAL